MRVVCHASLRAKEKGVAILMRLTLGAGLGKLEPPYTLIRMLHAIEACAQLQLCIMGDFSLGLPLLSKNELFQI